MASAAEALATQTPPPYPPPAFATTFASLCKSHGDGRHPKAGTSAESNRHTVKSIKQMGKSCPKNGPLAYPALYLGIEFVLVFGLLRLRLTLEIFDFFEM